MELDLFSDAQLMALFCHGRDDAFRLLYDRHRDRVYRLALRMTGDPSDAEELVQETFIRVARAADRYVPSAAFTTWLHRIGLNVCLSHLERRRGGNVVHLFEVRAVDDPQALAEAREVAEVLQQKLLTLDVALRSAFVLRVCEGMSYKEVAEILEVPLATARTHVHRARGALRRSMGRALGEERR